MQNISSHVNSNNFTTNTSIDNAVDMQDVPPPKRIFPTARSAPPCTRISAFESDLIDLVKNVEFRYVHSDFHNSLRKDIKRINKCKNMLVFSDKTNNLYEVKPKAYNNLLRNNITRDYKLCDNEVIDNINNEAFTIINNNNIQGKIPKLDRSAAYITIKDHKDNFPSQIKCRLINPSKTHIGKISKSIIDKIVMDIRVKTGLVQWKNSQEVIAWFNNIQQKRNKCFINFDIVEFYPSITKGHLVKALEFAKGLSNFTDNDIEIILHACKTVLFSQDRVWHKKENNNSDLFDVPMGSFHGAEICDLIGLFILSKLSKILDVCGMYRDDGLALININSPQHYVRLEKKIINLFKEIGFKITIDIGKIRTNFLDVSLDLYHDSYMPYCKPNSNLSYINYKSNHPRHIKKELPKMIEKRLISLSKDKQVFDKIKPVYDHALAKAGFKHPLKYNQHNCSEAPVPSTGSNKRKRKRTIIYFNPPFCESVKTNIGREFLKLVDRHFPINHTYHNLFNRKTLKISYSCMNNVKCIIQSHNKRILNDYNKVSANIHNHRSNNTNVSVDVPSVHHEGVRAPAGAGTSNINLSNNSGPKVNVTPIKTDIIKKVQVEPLSISRYNLRSTPSRVARNMGRVNSNIDNIPCTSTSRTSAPNTFATDYNQIPNRIMKKVMPVVASNAPIQNTYTNTAINDNSINHASHLTIPTNNRHNDLSSGCVKLCNCRVPHLCPLDGKCLVDNVVYKVVATYNNNGIGMNSDISSNDRNNSNSSSNSNSNNGNDSNNNSNINDRNNNINDRNYNNNNNNRINNNSNNSNNGDDSINRKNNNKTDKIYIGSTGTLFKKRFYNHRQSFINVNNRNATELSKYMWSCLDRFNQQPELQWSILHRTNAPTSARKICHLCNLERWEIALADDRRNLLNKRSEVSGGCPHHRSLFFPRLKPKS